MRTLRSALAVGAGLLLVAPLAACSGDDSSAPATVTNTVTDAVTSTTAVAGGATTPGTTSAGAPSVSNISASLDGQDIALNMDTARCSYTMDDGVEEVHLDTDIAGTDSNGVDVEIQLTDPLRLDGLDVDRSSDDEWDAEDNQKAAAEVTRDGDTYTVVSQVTNDDDSSRTGEARVSFTCTR